MKEINNWDKLISLPKGVIKEHGFMTGEYTIRISYSDGTWFIEYVYSGLNFSETEYCYPERFSGDALDIVVGKATDFFETNFGKYKLIG